MSGVSNATLVEVPVIRVPSGAKVLTGPFLEISMVRSRNFFLINLREALTSDGWVYPTHPRS